MAEVCIFHMAGGLFKDTVNNSRWFLFPALQYLGHFQSENDVHRLATLSGLNDMFPWNGVQRALMYVFSPSVGVSEVITQSAATCIGLYKPLY